jgi:cytochrome c2
MSRRAPHSLFAWAAVAALTLAGGLAACGTPQARSQQVGSGNAELGRELMTEYGCTSCHVVPGIRSEPAYVGPPLDHWGRRSYIAGSLNNNERNLVRWIVDPQDVEEGTAMPDVGASEQDAINIAAYLLSIE